MQVVVPLLGVNKTAVVGISTPDKEDNYYSILLDVKGEDGKPLFKSIKIGLSCDDCIERGVAAQCPHKSNSLPPWKSEGRQDKIRRIMQSHMSTFIREALGRINSGTEHVFATFLPALRATPRYNLKNRPRRIDIGIDPSGAGSSEYSLVSTVYEEGRRVVIGIDSSVHYHINHVEEMILRHLKSLRQHFMYKRAVFYLYVENNHSFFDPQLIERLVQEPRHRLGRVVVVDFDKQNKGGVPTGKDSKPAYTYAIRELLTYRRLCISMHTVGKNFEGNIEKLYSQLGNWHKVIKETTQPGFTDPSISYTGKKDGENDDILIGLMLSVYYGHLQFQRESLM